MSFITQKCDIWKQLIQEERDVCRCYQRLINLLELQSTAGANKKLCRPMQILEDHRTKLFIA